MTDTTEKKTTPDSTRRYRLAIAALKAVEEAQDHEVHTAIGEFQSFVELYVAARLREVDARSMLLPSRIDVPAGQKPAQDRILANMHAAQDAAATQKHFAGTASQK